MRYGMRSRVNGEGWHGPPDNTTRVHGLAGRTRVPYELRGCVNGEGWEAICGVVYDGG